MLTQRTNVLFSPDEYGMLLTLSKSQSKTMGELIRRAVRKTYKVKSGDSFAKSMTRIRKLTKGIKVTRKELREWVVEGRKYES